MIDEELLAVDARYDKEKCPEDLRREQEREQILKRKEKYLEDRAKLISEYDVVKNVSDYLKDSMDTMYKYIDQFDEEYNVIEYDEFESINSGILYDDIKSDAHEIKSEYEYVHSVFEERQKIGEAILASMFELEKKEKENNEKSIIAKIFDEKLNK